MHFGHETLVVPPAMLLRPARDLPPFDPAELTALDWTGIDLTVESQGVARRPESIQARVITHVDGLADWDVIIDDDGSGEVADIVAMPTTDACTFVSFIASGSGVAPGGVPRARVADLYEVCAQVQKSAKGRRNVSAMLLRLIDVSGNGLNASEQAAS